MEYLSEILSFIVGLITGVTIKIVLDNSKNSTIIKNNNATGDIAGRDIKK